MNRLSFSRLSRHPLLAPIVAPLRAARRIFSRVRHRWALFANYVHDFRRFVRFGSPDRALPLANQQQAFLIMLAHSLEKGLALPAPRPGFGQDTLRSLLTRLDSYIRDHGDDWASQTSIQAIEAYLAFNADNPAAASLDWAATEAALLRTSSQYWSHNVKGGTLSPREAADAEVTPFPIEEFLHSRHSIRNFRDQLVAPAVLREAIALAQSAPSVCNRQAGRVHVIPRSPLANRILELQGGNRGFGYTASHILLISSDLRCFLSIGERNQMWVDGGLFAMTLVHAFHGLGVGTCFLNWSVDMTSDAELRRRLPIPEWENVITMLAIGYAAPGVKACVSQRRPLSDVFTLHDEALAAPSTPLSAG